MTDANTDSIKIMRAIDAMTPSMRALVHEYGFTIVHEMRAEGHMNAVALRPILEGWRRRRQDEWLQTNYVQPKVLASMERALICPSV